jgi:hypothetical protein
MVYQSGCTSLHSHQQHMRVTFSPHPCQHSLLVVFLIVAMNNFFNLFGGGQLLVKESKCKEGRH